MAKRCGREEVELDGKAYGRDPDLTKATYYLPGYKRVAPEQIAHPSIPF